MVPALVILGLWTALLGPGVARWLRQHQPTTSIASFHRQLRGLEHSGPKLVEPAYRLGGAGRRNAQSHEQRRIPKRPHLVLLKTGAIEKESTMNDGHYGDEYAEPWASTRRPAASHDEWDDPWSDPFADPSFDDPRSDPPTRAYRTVRAPRADEYADPRTRARHRPVALSPDDARARRSRILLGLGGAILGTILLGLIPGLTILWALTVLCVVGLAAYLGLMYYASNVGLYRAHTSERTSTRTPIARAVVPALHEDRYDDDLYDDDWGDERIAAAR